MDNIIDTKKIGERIYKLRKKNNDSQEKLALEIDLSQNGISKIESGNVKPKLETLIKIAKYFEVSPDYLLTGKNTNSILELLEKYIYLTYNNFSDGINTYHYPVLKISKPFFDYLVNSEEATSEKHIPDNIREIWLKQVKEKFYESNKTNDYTECVEFVPVPRELIYPDDQKDNWTQNDLIREINNKWSNG